MKVCAEPTAVAAPSVPRPEVEVELLVAPTLSFAMEQSGGDRPADRPPLRA